MPYCRKCGAKQCDDFVFCTECGVKRLDPNEITDRTDLSLVDATTFSNDEVTVKKEMISSAASANDDEPAKKSVLSVDYNPPVTVSVPLDTNSNNGNRFFEKTVCVFLLVITCVIQFLPFYRVDSMFYEFEASNLGLIMKVMENVPSSAELELTVLMLINIFSTIAMISAVIYFMAAGGVGFLITSLVVSGLVQAYVPAGMPFSDKLRIAPSSETFTVFLYLYFIFMIISIIALMWYNSQSKKYI